MLGAGDRAYHWRMKSNPNRPQEEADAISVRDYLNSPEPDPSEYQANARFDDDDDQPGIPSGYLERASETRRSPIPRTLRRHR
jgi:hypothetical protein